MFGSRRCDCGDQLDRAIRLIEEEGRGVLLYLRQEGRGIGLLDKLEAYNLQDTGVDTVDANLALGHPVDARDYTVAAQMLSSLGVDSIRLLTNNPAKIEALEELGVEVVERIPLTIPPHGDNRSYLQTKVERMRHMINLEEAAANVEQPRAPGLVPTELEELFDWLAEPPAETGPLQRPRVTLSYAQSLDGCSSALRDRPLALSGEHSLRLTHRLRGAHDAILVGIGTVLADNPRLTVRLAEAPDPQPIVLDSRLRFPIDAALLDHPTRQLWIATTEAANPERAQRLEELGVRLIRVSTNERGQIELHDLLRKLHALDIGSIMVEGGARVITQFIYHRLVDRYILTIAPALVGGMHALEHLPGSGSYARVSRPRYAELGPDMIVWGALE